MEPLLGATALYEYLNFLGYTHNGMVSLCHIYYSVHLVLELGKFPKC